MLAVGISVPDTAKRLELLTQKVESESKVSRPATLVPLSIERPKAGDLHPFDGRLASLLFTKIIPNKYLKGLKACRLRTRQTSILAISFSAYNATEREVQLFSLPMEWKLPHLPSVLHESISEFGAKVSSVGRNQIVIWPDKLALALWCYANAIAPQIAKHYVASSSQLAEQEKGNTYHEVLEELHSVRTTQKLFRFLYQSL